LACPRCGGRLVSKTAERPPRLICSDCGQLVPNQALPPLIALLERLAALALVLGLGALSLHALHFDPSSPLRHDGEQRERSGEEG
jgi:hypothetical protein